MRTRFGFISHTFEHENLRGVAPTLYRKSADVAARWMESLPPKETCRITELGSLPGSDVEGVVVTTWLYPSQYLTLPGNLVFQKILDAVRVAEREGAQVVGLGGYNSIVPPGSGLRIARNSRIGVTNGNTYTIALAVEGTKEAVRRAGLSLGELSAAVIGATGSVGGVVCELLACERPGELTLVARNQARLQGRVAALLETTGYQARCSVDVAAAVRGADVIVSATSTPGTVIDLADISPGTIICDVAVPHDVAQRVVAERDDVLVFEGGLARTPAGSYLMRPYLAGDLGLGAGELYACFCETALLAMDGRFDDFSLDGISVEQVRTIRELAGRHGFGLAALRNKKERPIPEEKYARVGALLRERRCREKR